MSKVTEKDAFALTVALTMMMAIAIVPVLASPKVNPTPNPSPKCNIQTNPSTIHKKTSLSITVQLVNMNPSSTYSGTAIVTLPDSSSGGSALYIVLTDSVGAGKATQVYPFGYSGGSTSMTGTYTVSITLVSGYTSVSCTALFTIG
ncbi:MAG: hypothetical protein HY296_02730 [Thaumarchaeota archaeon]|nr:hypothetical protein [Nitrososphaerota archaeon]